jgi:hypothetical protein
MPTFLTVRSAALCPPLSLLQPSLSAPYTHVLVHRMQTFYPQVVAAKKAADAHETSAYCSFSDPSLQLWTSSMFLGGESASTHRPSACSRSTGQDILPEL